MARQEDFVFAERVLQHGYATEEQVQECLSLLDRLRAEMQLDESLRNLMVKKGYLAPAQASVLDAEIDPRPRNAIEGYRLLDRLGSGAMGSVYKAHHVKLDIPVALKVLRPSLASSKTQIERLKREAQLAARLSHPNVVRSLDVGESNGFHYLAMEFVEGKTVRDLLAKGPLPEEEAFRIARQVAAGLAHAHAHGVVHRDVKPGNVMLTQDGTAKLGDFGLARGQAPSDLTLEHASIGTPQYVAPEQMRRGSDATPRSDLFSLGATLYHMVTGRPPFDGENLGEIVQNVLGCRFQPPEALVPGLSRDTVYVIDRLLRANPRERYADAAELVADLERIGRGEPIAPADFVGDYQSFLRKRRRRRNAILAACAAVLAGAGVLYHQHQATEREETELARRCAVAAATGSDAVAAATLEALSGGIDAMKEAESAARGCDPAAIESLRKRLGLFEAAFLALQKAEDAFGHRNDAVANYRKLYEVVDGPRTGLPRVAERIEEIGTEIRGRSDKAATDRYNRVSHSTMAEVIEEARAFAKDLDARYLALDLPWVDDVAQAPRRIDAFESAWQALDPLRDRFDSDLHVGRYGRAAALLQQIREGERSARGDLFRNAYLARFSDVPSPRDGRETRLADEEWKKWELDILPAATSFLQATPSDPEAAEKKLTEFLADAHATRGKVEEQLAFAKGRREEMVREQEARYVSDDALFKNSLKARAYAKANRDVAAVATSVRWLKGPAARYAALGERAAAVAELPKRFLDGARKQKTVKIRKGVEVAGRDIEAAPGDDRDLFVARRGRERIEFTLAELDPYELERIFAPEAGVARDKVSGWFHAAESFREEHPYNAEKLRQKARVELPPDDAWMPDLESATEETGKRIALGERRAEQAKAEFTEARDKGKHMEALSLCQELLSLVWTKACENRKDYYVSELVKLRRIASRQLLPVQLGVPESQIAYDAAGNPTITFTGKVWCPVVAPPDATPEELDRLSRAFWESWFKKTLGMTDKQVEDLDLLARAMTQRLAWRGAVEAGPKGGYLPGRDARLGKEWWDAPPTKPQPLLLDFPFLGEEIWSIEVEVRGALPGYFVLGCGRIQAVVGYLKAESTGGGMKGACLVESDAMDPGAFTKQILDLQWYLVEDTEHRRRLTEDKEKAYLDEFVEGAAYGMRLARTRDSIVFEMWPLGVPREKQDKATVRLEKRYPDPRKLDKLVTLDDGRAVFRFFGAPAGNAPYELHDVKITGTLSERNPDVE